MAVLQISKIQVRRGQETLTGVPALSSGELAWSIDAQRLYIGNGSVSEGAPAVGNTEILTQNSNIFNLLGQYTYGSSFTLSNVTILTGPDSNHPISRSLSQKLDDVLTTRDFGVKGDGVTDDTNALQQAISQTYLNSDYNIPSSRKTLKIPAGTYMISNTIYLPSNVALVGDGIDRTVIRQTTTGTSVFQFVGFNPSGSGTFSNLILKLPNIQSAGNNPSNILVQGMTVQFDNALVEVGQVGLVEADFGWDCQFTQVKFQGVATTPISDTIKGIEIRGQGIVNSTRNLKIDNCIFDNLSAGIYSDYDSSYIHITNNTFRNLGQGIVFGGSLPGLSGSTPSIQGPTNVLIKNNRFENIYLQGLYVGSFNTGSTVLSYVTSENNEYLNCGNHSLITSPGSDLSPILEVITFQTSGNISRNDYFSRVDYINGLFGAPTSYIAPVKGNLTAGNVVLESQYPSSLTVPIVADTVNGSPILVVAQPNTSQALEISYVAKQGTITRRGELKVLNDSTLSAPVVLDNYSYNGSTDGRIAFTATSYANSLTVAIINPNAITNLEYSYKQLY